MPFVSIRVAGRDLSTADVKQLQQGATRLMVEVMRKNAALTAVSVERVPDGGWSVGGSPVPLAAHLEVRVTAGTNTAAEKAAFVSRANALLRSVLGEALHDVTYVVVHELPADAWGWDGMTQGARAAAAREV